MSYTKIHKFEGKLVIPEGKFEYAIFSNKTIYIELHSLSDILKNIYLNSPSSNVRVFVQVFDRKLDKYIDIFNKKGELNMNKSQGLWDWFVGKFDLGVVLFNNAENKVIVEIEDLDFSKYTDVKSLEEEE